MGDGNLDCRGFVDLHHAFHTVDHQKLLPNMHHYGICGVSND